MKLLRFILNGFEFRRANNLIANVHNWYFSSNGICKQLGDALIDENIGATDIGIVLDKTDRQLFMLRIYSSDAQSSLRKNYPRIAQQIANITDCIFRLRNETAKFLIHSQGPGSVLVNQPLEGQAKRHYYTKSLEDYGFKARNLHKSLDSEIQTLWREMQTAISYAKKIVITRN
jgi:hypothetical protein